MKRSLPVAKSLLAAAAFVPRAITQAPGALLLFAAVLAAPVLFGFIPMSPPAMLGAHVVLAAAALLATLMAQGALYRLAATPTVAAARSLGLGPLGLQLGAAELRLVVSGLLVGLFLGLAVLAAGLLLAFVANIAGLDLAGLDVSPTYRGAWPEAWRSGLLIGAVVLAAWLVFQLAVRLSLYQAATVARRRLVSVSALGLSEHNFWRLLIGLAIVSLPGVALTILIAAARVDAPWGARAWAHVAFALGLAFVQLPLSIGFLGGAYQRLEHWRAS